MLVVLSDEPIPGSVDGQKVLRLLRIGFELLAKAHQVRVYGTGGWVILVTPNLLQEAVAAQCFAGMADEILQQIELFGGDIQGLA